MWNNEKLYIMQQNSLNTNFPKVISFCNQKGGAGKSTATMITSAICQAYSPFLVDVYDLDWQKTISKFRDAEQTEVTESASLIQEGSAPYVLSLDALEFYNPENKTSYSIYKEIRNPDSEREHHLVFLDLPGQTSESKIQNIYQTINYAIVPLRANRLDIQSSFDFLDRLVMLKQAKEKIGEDYLKIGCFINYYGKTLENKELPEIIKENYGEHIYVFERYLKNNIRYSRDISTVYPLLLKNNIKDFELYHFINEFCSFIEIPKFL